MNKPGYKTTEFWLTAAAAIVGLLFASGIIPTDSSLYKLLGLAATTLGTMGYAVSRGMVKSAVPMIVAGSLLEICMTGCTTYETGVYRTLGTVSVTVDQAMCAWGDWVQAGQTSPADEDQVKALYGQYQSAMRTAHAAELAYEKDKGQQNNLNIALDMLQGSASALVDFVRKMVGEENLSKAATAAK